MGFKCVTEKGNQVMNARERETENIGNCYRLSVVWVIHLGFLLFCGVILGYATVGVTTEVISNLC
jgi:hypothetical protein